MTITLKEFGQFVLDFVQQQFIPHLHSHIPEQQHCLEQWKQVSDLIKDIQKQNIWNLTSYLSEHNPISNTTEPKDLKEFKKVESSKPSANNFGSFDNFLEKKDALRHTHAYQQSIRTHPTPKHNNKQQSEPRNKSFKYSASVDDYESKMSIETKPRGAQGGQQVDGFDRLIQSFRKLCVNFDNNHKKLLKQDKNLKQNLKIQLTHH